MGKDTFIGTSVPATRWYIVTPAIGDQETWRAFRTTVPLWCIAIIADLHWPLADWLHSIAPWAIDVVFRSWSFVWLPALACDWFSRLNRKYTVPLRFIDRAVALFVGKIVFVLTSTVSPDPNYDLIFDILIAAHLLAAQIAVLLLWAGVLRLVYRFVLRRPQASKTGTV